MTILAIRTDKPGAEIYLYKDKKRLAQVKWQAHLKLAESLNTKIGEILNKLSISYEDLGGIAIYKGPGSFTGLRIGMSVANALAYSMRIPIAAKGGENWMQNSIEYLSRGRSDKIAVPEYGSPVFTTKPRK